MRFLKKILALFQEPPLPPAHVRQAAEGAAIEAYLMEVGTGWIYRRHDKYCGWLAYGKTPHKAKSYVEGHSRREVIIALEKINKVFKDKVLLINSWKPQE